MEPIFVRHLALWHHTPSTTPVGRVLLIHGLGEHSGRHTNSVEFLVREGFEVVRFDLRGAGRSGGRRQWVEKFTDYVDDTTDAYQWISRTLPARPLIVLGHSLGGAIAAHFAALRSRTLQGLILSAPAYITGSAISPLKIAVGRVVAKVLPTARVPAQPDFDALSRNRDVGEAYRVDPLSCHFNTLQQGKEILDALKTMPEQMRKIECPVVLVHGSADRVIRCEGSFQLLQACQMQKKEFHIYPGGYHELHNDLAKDEYFTQLRYWLRQRLEDNRSETR